MGLIGSFPRNQSGVLLSWDTNTYIYIYIFPSPVVPSPPPTRLRRCWCVALQCDLLILQHATSCSAVASDSAQCHDASCGLQRRNQVLTKCAATRQWGLRSHCATILHNPQSHRGGRGGGWEPWTPPRPIPQWGGGLVGPHCATFLTEHDHWGGGGGVGRPRKPGTYIYIYTYIPIHQT